MILKVIRAGVGFGSGTETKFNINWDKIVCSPSVLQLLLWLWLGLLCDSFNFSTVLHSLWNKKYKGVDKGVAPRFFGKHYKNSMIIIMYVSSAHLTG